MASKAMLSFLLIISSVHLCLSENNSGSSLDQLLPSLVQASVVQDAQCMQKLLPCQPFLKSPNNPPHACCVPLSEMATKETDCLCSVFNNPELLLSFNVSKADALKLPEACDIKVDVSKCNNTGTNSSSQAGDASSSSQGDATDPEEEASEDSTSSTKIISPYGIISFGVPGFVALLTTLVFSAY